MPETFTLDVRCPECGGMVRLQFTDWNREQEEHVESTYRCPYCNHDHHFRAAGRAVWATAQAQTSDSRH